MMNSRRTFFKQLALGFAALSAPSIFIPKLIEPPVWKINKGWTAEDIALYERLPFYLAKMELKINPEYVAWQNLLEGVKWEPNMGSTTRFINI